MSVTGRTTVTFSPIPASAAGPSPSMPTESSCVPDNQGTAGGGQPGNPQLGKDVAATIQYEYDTNGHHLTVTSTWVPGSYHFTTHPQGDQAVLVPMQHLQAIERGIQLAQDCLSLTNALPPEIPAVIPHPDSFACIRHFQ